MTTKSEVTEVDLGGGWSVRMDAPEFGVESSSFGLYAGEVRAETADARICRALFAEKKRADKAAREGAL